MRTREYKQKINGDFWCFRENSNFLQFTTLSVFENKPSKVWWLENNELEGCLKKIPWPNLSTTSKNVWRNRKNHGNIKQVAGLSTDVRTWHFPNTSTVLPLQETARTGSPEKCSNKMCWCSSRNHEEGRWPRRLNVCQKQSRCAGMCVGTYSNFIYCFPKRPCKWSSYKR